MTSKAVHAWVLHKSASGDTSAHVTFFTREMGVVRALCKGGRTPKKQALLQPFTPLWITLDVKRTWHYVCNLDVCAPSIVLKGDALFSGLYLNELLYLTQQPLEHSPELYDSYTQALQSLTQVTQRIEIERILRRFEWQFIMLCGYAVSLSQDARSFQPIKPCNHYTFIPSEGFSLTKTGILGEHLLAMADDSFHDVDVLRSAKLIMRRAIDHILDGKLLKTRELYQAKFNNIMRMP